MVPEINDDLTHYWTALGFSTAVWSALELVLDTDVQLIRKHYGGKQIEPEVPRGLKPTVKFLRKCFTHLDSLQVFKSPMLQLLDEVDRLSERRHLVVHGAAVGFITGAGVPLKRLRGAKTTYLEDEQTISITEIYNIGHESTPLVAQLAKLGVDMKAPFPGSVFDEE